MADLSVHYFNFYKTGEHRKFSIVCILSLQTHDHNFRCHSRIIHSEKMQAKIKTSKCNNSFPQLLGSEDGSSTLRCNELNCLPAQYR
jgi:hypothetical protein